MGLQSMGVECPKVRASDEHCYIVRVLRAQGHPTRSPVFLSFCNLARRYLTGGADLGARPPATTCLHFLSLSTGVLF